VVDHLEQRSLPGHDVEGEEAEHHEAQVGDRGVGHQLLHVDLHPGDEGAVEDADHRERDEQRLRLQARLREERQRETQEAIGAELEEDAGQDHRAAGRRFDVGVGQPGVHREHRHLDGEGQRERREQPDLLVEREAQAQHVAVGEAPGAVVQALEGPCHPQDGDQHQQAPRHGEQEELDRRVDPPLAAPDPDQQVHRDQHDLPEDVEEEEVPGQERAEHAGGEQQQRGAERRPVAVDPLPRAEDDDRHQEDAEHRERHRDAVHRQVVADAVVRDPGDALQAEVMDSREGAVRGEVRHQVLDAEEDLGQRGGQHVDLRPADRAAGEEEQWQAGQRREEHQAGERVAEEQVEDRSHR